MKDICTSVIYQIYPKSFCDTTGSGTGDINGITKKLDYLEELGVDYIWSTPFFVSPQKDNGYDIADYLSVDPVYGTIKDVERLIEEAGKRKIGIMFDMVFNHTSTEHEWFQKALSGDRKYMDYYIFKDNTKNHTPPTNWLSKFGGNAWEYVEHLDKWYLHLFDKSQADLNWNNPKVREELKKVIRFWKDKGVKGFRFDVVNLIAKPDIYEDDLEGDGRKYYTDGEKIHQYLKELVADTQIQDMITVGEMSSTSIEHCMKYSNPLEQELSMCFNFHHLKVDYKEKQKWELQECDFIKLKNLLSSWQLGMQEENGWNAVFWCNHDQPRIVSRFGDDKQYRNESAKMLVTMIHLLRGTPYVYQGEEIGMTNGDMKNISEYRDVESLNYYKILKDSGKEEREIYHILKERSRDNARTPMQWSDQENAGFTTGIPWIGVNANYKTINVYKELKDKKSIFYYYQQLITLRKEYEVIGNGVFAPILEVDENIFAYTRKTEEEVCLVVTNFRGFEVGVTLEMFRNQGYKQILSNYEDTPSIESIEKIRPYEAIVYYKKC